MSSEEGDEGERIEILLVEPNPGDTRLFTEKFQEAKLINRLHTVSDGEAAIEFLQQRGDYEDAPQPDLILLEPELPGKPSRDVLSELNNDPALRDIPVVVLVGSQVEEEIVKTHGLDADQYIQKPVEPEEFIDFVQSVEDFWLAIVQQPSADD